MAAPRALFLAARNFKRMLPLMRDQRVPLRLKLFTGALALFILSPLDIFGDIPVLGILDDAVLLALVCAAFVWLATRTIEKNVTPARVRSSSLVP
jgi:uncharacterized membrane protein YkvA (DUF1232 family)